MRSMALAAVGLGALWLFSAHSSGNGKADVSTGREIRASRYILVDSAGKERGEFGMTADGEPALRVWDRESSVSATVEIDSRGMPRVALERSDGHPLVELGVLDKEHPVFLMHDGAGVRRVGLVVAGEQEVATLVYDGAGQQRLRVGLDKSGNPEITMRDENGEGRVHITHNEKGGAGIDLFDSKGRARAVLQVDSAGSGAAALVGSDGKPIWTSAATGP